MKKLLSFSLILVTLFATSSMFAELRIGVVSMPKIMNEAPQLKSAQAAIKTEFESKKAQIQAESQRLVDLQNAYQRDFDALSDDQKRAKLEEINTKRRAFLEKENKMLNELNKKRNEKLLQFQETLMTQVRNIGKELGYDLIVGEGVLYASPTIDITDKVLARLR